MAEDPELAAIRARRMAEMQLAQVRRSVQSHVSHYTSLNISAGHPLWMSALSV